jgi:hypothetical protein
MRLPLLAGVLCALTLTACGDDGSATTPAPPVRLAVTAPSDLGTVRSGTVTVRGTVVGRSGPVLVRGARARSSSGAWSAEVTLEPGVNVVDVLAASGRARPAMTAVRVRRVVDVEVPDVVGFSVGDARDALSAARLKADLQTTGGGFFDELLGGDPQVCATDPEAGAHVDPGATVTVEVSRRC